MVELTTDIDTKIERGLKFWEEQAEKQQELKIGQQQENQYNTDITETKERKDAIKAENENAKRERIY